ncbi:hypothetical protein TWF481_007550 [Arthrobotrys musiformis]|uniref:Uncharacterized protein n=1 Tax=Arthrobotrys musiformis TaxID=47236 RepID=A0AAV9WCN4_9PEZI
MKPLYLFISTTRFLSNLPVSFAFPTDVGGSSGPKSLEKRLWLADLPPIDPEEPPGFYKQEDQGAIDRLIKYGDTTTCVLSLFASSRGNIGDENRWIGWPMGNEMYRYRGENTCKNVKDLNKNLVNQLSSYQVKGHCDCEFFDGENCENSKFMATNREDDTLREHGNNDIIESYKCWTAVHWEDAKKCYVFYGPKDLKNALFGAMLRNVLPEVLADVSEVHLEKPHFQTTIPPEKMVTKTARGESWTCFSIDTTIQVESIVVTGCSCIFYLDSECTMPLSSPDRGVLSVGNLGWDDITSPGETSSLSVLRSYACAPPYGINRYPEFRQLPPAPG